MATVTRENIAKLHDKITVKLTKEDFMPSFEKSLKNYAKTANVPGFRKGMVPAGMVRKMHGQSVFNEEIIRRASNELENYIRSEKLAIFAQPMMMAKSAPQQMDMNAPTDVDFEFEIGVKPEFSIPAIENKIALTKYKIEVSDKMLDDEIGRIARRYGAPEDKDLVESKDDVVTITLQAANSEGVVAEGIDKIEDTALVERYPAQFQEKLMGKKAGDSFVIRPMDVCTEAELPAFLQNPIKNADAADYYFKITLTKVALIIPAAIDDNLYAQVFQGAEVKDEAQFREMIRVELGREYERITIERLNQEIYELLVHKTPIELPETFLKRYLEEGQEKRISKEEVEKQFPSFEHQLRWTLISDKIVLENGIKVSLEDVNTNIKGRVLAYFGIQNGDEAPWIESYMEKISKDEKTLNETYQQLMTERLFGFLHSQLSIAETNINEEEFFKLPHPHDAHHAH